MRTTSLRVAAVLLMLSGLLVSCSSGGARGALKEGVRFDSDGTVRCCAAYKPAPDESEATAKQKARALAMSEAVQAYKSRVRSVFTSELSRKKSAAGTEYDDQINESVRILSNNYLSRADIEYHRSGTTVYAVLRATVTEQDITSVVNKTMARKMYEKGFQLAAREHYPEAIEAFAAAIDWDPDDAKAYTNLGVCYAKLAEEKSSIVRGKPVPPVATKEFQLALRYLRESLRLDSANASARGNIAATEVAMGKAFLLRGKTREAEACFQRAVKTSLERAETYNDMGAAWIALAQLKTSGQRRIAKTEYDRGMECLLKAVKLRPGYAMALRNIVETCNDLGARYGQAGNMKEAIRAFTIAIEMDEAINRHASVKSWLAKSFYNRAVAYVHVKEYASAVRDCTRAVEINPNYADGYYQRAVAHMRRKQVPQAVSDLKRAAGLGHSGAQNALRKQGIKW